MTSNIGREAHTYVFLKEKLLEEHASLRTDGQALEDTLEGICNFNQAVEWFVDSIANDEAMLVGMKGRAKNLDARIKRIAQAIAAKRNVLRDALEKVGKDNIKHPEFTVFLSKVKAKISIEDVELLPEEYITVVQVPTKVVKKDELEAALLNDNKEVPGAVVVPEYKTLGIRKG